MKTLRRRTDWLDRRLFPYVRPDTFLTSDLEDIENTAAVDDASLQFQLECHMQSDLLVAAPMLRRTLIVAAAMIAIGLGA